MELTVDCFIEEVEIGKVVLVELDDAFVNEVLMETELVKPIIEELLEWPVNPDVEGEGIESEVDELSIEVAKEVCWLIALDGTSELKLAGKIDGWLSVTMMDGEGATCEVAAIVVTWEVSRLMKAALDTTGVSTVVDKDAFCQDVTLGKGKVDVCRVLTSGVGGTGGDTVVETTPCQHAVTEFNIISHIRQTRTQRKGTYPSPHPP